MGSGELSESLSWLAEARKGDQESFTRLYELVAPPLYTWASLRLRGSRGRPLDPSDLVQEVWCRAWRKLPQLEEDVPLRPWLFRIAKNVLLEATRASQRRDAGGGMGSSTKRFALENAPDSATAVSRRLMRDESLAAFNDLVAGLEREERELLRYCGLEGMPHEEVAQRLELGRETITKRWQRLRARLKAGPLPEGILVED